MQSNFSLTNSVLSALFCGLPLKPVSKEEDETTVTEPRYCALCQTLELEVKLHKINGELYCYHCAQEVFS
jgi:hypothetical protein